MVRAETLDVFKAECTSAVDAVEEHLYDLVV